MAGIVGKTVMKKIYVLILALVVLAVQPFDLYAKKKKNKEKIELSPKHDFRGAWIQTAWQDRYQRMNPDQCMTYLKGLVDMLHEIGFNAIVFQVRPEGDAFYDSNYEPWSRFMTGRQGKAPVPEWDPMAYMIELCHERQMEFHAWINPYRMSTSKSLVMDKQHIYHQHPDWFVTFDNKLYLNPGLPESRYFIRDVVKDIVSRYDIDAIHMDDYFYPYPVAGQTFDDKEAFDAYAPQMNIDVMAPNALSDFRRRNVDILIKTVHEDIQSLKPWVRFGISPFGIYRNKKSWEGGSETAGTQCYDDLYADVIFWAKNGWIDYLIPQIYWEIGHKLADYTTLVKWWNENVPENCHLYIGQSIERSLDGTAASAPALNQSHQNFLLKLEQAAALDNVKGNCYWYAYQIEDNQFKVRDFLVNNVFLKKSLLPAYTSLDKKEPNKVKEVKAVLNNHELTLSWTAPEDDGMTQKPKFYNVYRFKKDEKVKINDCSHLLGQTSEITFLDKTVEVNNTYTYVITAVDFYNNEGDGVKKSFKLKTKKK